MNRQIKKNSVVGHKFIFLTLGIIYSYLLYFLLRRLMQLAIKACKRLG